MVFLLKGVLGEHRILAVHGKVYLDTQDRKSGTFIEANPFLKGMGFFIATYFYEKTVQIYGDFKRLFLRNESLPRLPFSEKSFQ
jgi:hypothetical protein